jgi:hypothetical protein
MRELSLAEQRYQAVLAVSDDGLSISQVASKMEWLTVTSLQVLSSEC